MPATNYASLREQVLRWSTGSSDTDTMAAIEDAIAFAEADMAKLVRVPELISRYKAFATQEFEALPSGTDNVERVISLKELRDGKEVPMVEVHQAAWDSCALPRDGRKVYALVGSQVRFRPAPTPTSPLGFRLVFFGPPPALTADNPCTRFLTTYPALYLYGTLYHFAAYQEDDAAAARWRSRFQDQVLIANAASNARGLV